MNRLPRRFRMCPPIIATVAALLLAAPPITDAQPPGKSLRIGYVWSGAQGSDPVETEALRQGLRELAYVEHHNLLIEYRYAEGNPDRVPGLVAELINLKVAVLVTPGTAVTAAQRSMEIARAAARRLKVELVERPVTSIEELRAGLQALRPGEVDAFFHVSDAMVNSQPELIIDAATVKKLPTMLAYQGNVALGALASYGESYYTLGRRSAKHVQRILLGADPGSLPVE